MKPHLLEAGTASFSNSVVSDHSDRKIAYLPFNYNQLHTDAQNIAVLWHEIGEYPNTFYPNFDFVMGKYNAFERYELKKLISQKI